MIKRTKKLALQKETIRALSKEEARKVAGGAMARSGTQTMCPGDSGSP
jgi:hypothetical protein